MSLRNKAVKVLCCILSLVLLLGVGVIVPDNIDTIAVKKHSVYVNTISKAVKNKAREFPHVSGELPDWRGVNVVDKAEFAWKNKNCGGSDNNCIDMSIFNKHFVTKRNGG